MVGRDPTPRAVRGLVWPAYKAENPAFLRLSLPPALEEGSAPSWEAVSFWSDFVPYLSSFATVDDLTAGAPPLGEGEGWEGMKDEGRYSPLTDRERIELGAYKRAWWALWLLVAAIALLLWTLVICLVARKCLSAPPDKPLSHLFLTHANQ